MEKPALTDGEKRCLRAFREIRKRSHVPPTVQEIADEMNVSRPTAHEYLVKLQQKGYVRRQGIKARSLEIIPRTRRAPVKRSA